MADMDTSVFANEKWLVTQMTDSKDNLEHFKAFFTCAFVAGTVHSREFKMSKAANGPMDEILEREWDKALGIFRGIVTSGAIADAKVAMKTARGFDA